MIVVEGPDGAGKTTLIETLKYYLGLPVADRVVSKDTEAMVDLAEWVRTNVESGFKPTIFDRHRLISEFIYGPTLREEQQPKFTEQVWTSEMLFRFYSCRPIIIYCLPPIEIVRANIAEDATNRVVWDKIDAIYTAYLQRAALDNIWYPMRTFIYDYTSDSSRELIAAVDSLLTKERSAHDRF